MSKFTLTAYPGERTPSGTVQIIITQHLAVATVESTIPELQGKMQAFAAEHAAASPLPSVQVHAEPVGRAPNGWRAMTQQSKQCTYDKPAQVAA